MQPRTALVFVAVLAHICSLSVVSGLSNEEFYDLVKDYITDVEIVNQDDQTESDVEDDDVITLPGGPDDELDLEYIADKLGLTNDKASRRVGFWHHHRHHNHHHSAFSCHCVHDSCSCCLKHTFRVNLWVKKIRFKLHACVTVAYLKDNIGFEITFTINGHRLFHKEVSLKHPPALCFGVPGLRTFARVCLEFYNIDLRSKRICARIAGVLDLKFKKFRVHLKLGCFKIPILDEQALESLLNDRDVLAVSVQASGEEGKLTEPEEIGLQELVTAFRQLRDEQETDNEIYFY